MVLKIHGQINENLYSDKTPNQRARDENYYDNPLIPYGTITKDETKHLSKGEKYTFSVLPTEVVTINILSTDDKDAEISVSGYGKEKKFSIIGTDKMGLFLAFQNR